MRPRTPGSLVDAASRQGRSVVLPVPVEPARQFRPRSAGMCRRPRAESGESP
ncbi:hypothetical protein [Nonomuraea sp. SYSU D8015]|uniref:hypothetical protein n=1 Tax=Nonomuraea sp. SYSU D8015 TaxID=2593644 RepID=UPI0016614EA8|nr:hypothetical protein [Nonomuraea sp. SYSU D8015]